MAYIEDRITLLEQQMAGVLAQQPGTPTQPTEPPDDDNNPPEPPDHEDDSPGTTVPPAVDPSTGGDQTGLAAKLVDILPVAAGWTFTLPSGKNGTTDSPNNDYPAEFSDDQLRPFVVIGQDQLGRFVDFRAKPASVVTTKNSKYGRAELRQTDGPGTWKLSAWSSAGPRILSARLAIDASRLSNRKRINGLQIHDGGDDVMQVMRRGPQLDGDDNDPNDYGLGVMYKDGKAWLALDPAYKDGHAFDCVITVKGNKVTTAYINLVTGKTSSASFDQTGSGWYWKAGDYMQTGGKSVWKEPASAEASVKLYRLDVG